MGIHVVKPSVRCRGMVRAQFLEVTLSRKSSVIACVRVLVCVCETQTCACTHTRVCARMRLCLCAYVLCISLYTICGPDSHKQSYTLIQFLNFKDA